MSEINRDNDRSYERISPTAWISAYQRTLSNIPFSQEIFAELQEIIKQTGSRAEIEDLEKLMKINEMTWVLEARFKIVNHLLKTHRINQIIEVAAGVSPRGLEMVKDPSVEYVEVDLPGAIQEKKSIVEQLIVKSIVSKQPNLHLEEDNALNLEDLLKATRFFKENSIAVVNEGFLPYLDLEGKSAFARNVHQLLERFGGIWITPDIPRKIPDTQGLSDEKLRFGRFKHMTEKLKHMTGVDISKNRFENEEEAQAFFENLGFVVERHSFIEVIDELVSPHPEEVEKIARLMTVFLMETTPRNPKILV